MLSFGVVAKADDASPRVVRSVKSGSWSDAASWDAGRPPQAGEIVKIVEGHDVAYDVDSEAVIRSIHVAGRLIFSKDRDTRLDVGLIRIEAGDGIEETGFDCVHGMAAEPAPADDSSTDSFHDDSGPALIVGSPNEPVPAEHRALIRLHAVEGLDPKSFPAIVCCGGRMDFHGAPMTTWVKLPFQSARVGEAKAVLPDPLPGWKVGDRIIFTGTTRQFGYLGTRTFPDNSVASNPTTEECIITGMKHWGGGDGKNQIVSFDKPLKFNHDVKGEHRGEVANLSRNVIVESADPEGSRGHTMYHRGSRGSISYAEFRHLGKKDVLGRYPIHFHLADDTMRGSSVIGASVWDSGNRWITIHGTQYLVVRDCVGYKSIGHGFFLEDGTEVFNVLDHNLAVQALEGEPLPDQVLSYDQNLGSGFWWANSLNTFTRNVAVECDEDGYRFEVIKTEKFNPILSVPQADGSRHDVDIRTLPFVRFEDNEAHCQRLFALNLGGSAQMKFAKPQSDVEGVGPDFHHPFVIRNFKVWDTHWGFHTASPCVSIDGAEFFDCTYAFWRCVMHRHHYERVSLVDVDNAFFFPRAAGESNYDYSIEDYFDLVPVDDLPPVSIITHVIPDGDSVTVRGTSSDNNDIKEVLINGKPVRPLRPNFAEWEVEFHGVDAARQPMTVATSDSAGNTEALPRHAPTAKQTSPSADGALSASP
jgi:hypothetical protein